MLLLLSEVTSGCGDETVPEYQVLRAGHMGLCRVRGLPEERERA